jgi:hypothetical protein
MNLQNSLVSAEQDPRSSVVYAGYLILSAFKDQERISIFDIHSILKKDGRNFTYSGTLYSLIFLYMNGLIDFDEPYIYKTTQ